MKKVFALAPVAAAAALFAVPHLAIAQEAPAAQSLDKVEVTGSRIRRTATEASTPVTVIKGEDLAKQGFVDVYSALQTLTQANGDTITEGGGGFAPFGKQLNMRTMGAGRTLLLINGRRAPDYPWTDGAGGNFQNFSMVPTVAIERIEVLAAGASAIYGSDAVAGVINIVLKKNIQKHTLSVTGKWPTLGGREGYDAQFSGGLGGERWSLSYGLQATGNNTLYGTERKFMDSTRDSPIPIDPAVGEQLPQQLRVTQTAAGALPAANVALPAGTCEAFGWEPYTVRSKNATTGVVTTQGPACGWDQQGPRKAISHGREDYSGYVFGRYDLSPKLQLWASLLAYDSSVINTAQSTLGFTGPRTTAAVPTTVGTFYDPSYRRNITVNRMLSPGETAAGDQVGQYGEESALHASVGLKGSFGSDWDFDLSLAHSQAATYLTRTLPNSAKLSDFFFGQALPKGAGTPCAGAAATTPCYALNQARWFRPMTPDEWASISEWVTYRNHSRMDQLGAVVTGTVMDLPAGPLQVAVAAEASRQRFESHPPEGLGTRTFGLTAVDGEGSRNRVSLGAELRIPLLATLAGTVSARADKYDDVSKVDLAKTWGLGLEWRPSSRLLVRGNLATSFKAPDMGFLGITSLSASQGNLQDIYTCLNDGLATNAAACNTAGSKYFYPVSTETKGDPNLREERGRSWGAGIVFDPTNQISITLDYYDVTLRGAIAPLTVANVLTYEANCRLQMDTNRAPMTLYPAGSEFCADIQNHITRDASGQLTAVRGGFVNQAYTRKAGFDASLVYRWEPTSLGRFTGRLAWNHVLADERQARAELPLDKGFRDALANTAFRSKINASLGWSFKGWNTNAYVIRYGSLPKANPAVDDPNPRLGSYTVVNLSTGTALTDRISMSLSVNNAFNRLPNFDSTQGAWPYFKFQYSPIGRELGLTLRYQFD